MKLKEPAPSNPASVTRLIQNQTCMPCSDGTMADQCVGHIRVSHEAGPPRWEPAVTWSPVGVLLSLKLCRWPPSSCQPRRCSLLWNESRGGWSFPPGTRAASGSCRPDRSDGWICRGRTSGKAVKLKEMKHQCLWDSCLVLRSRILSDINNSVLPPHGQKSELMFSRSRLNKSLILNFQYVFYKGYRKLQQKTYNREFDCLTVFIQHFSFIFYQPHAGSLLVRELEQTQIVLQRSSSTIVCSV